MADEDTTTISPDVVSEYGETNSKVLGAFSKRKEKEQCVMAAQRADDDARRDAAARYREKLQCMVGVFADELCDAIRVGNRRIEIGVWHRPYQYDDESKRMKTTFTPSEFRKPSCLVILFATATAEGMIEVLEDELRAFLNNKHEARVSLKKQELSRKYSEPGVVRAPKTYRYTLVLDYDVP